MRFYRWLFILPALVVVVGCSLFPKPTPAKPRTPVEKVTPEQLVGYLNDRASRLQTLSYGKHASRRSLASCRPHLSADTLS